MMTQKERGIPFSTELIPKIRDGTKTQTRRTWGLERINKKPDNWRVGSMDIAGRIIWVASHIDRSVAPKLKCPYGQVGDRLWVRETWCNPLGLYMVLRYKADGEPLPLDLKWRPSIHMPRWASRIDLEITEVRAERQLDITLEDAIAEGFGEIQEFNEAFLRLNPHLKETNPWVWCLSFKKVD